jgi:2-polyprenyl-3-methyl-5-hydroxy-6-metoxy-1,4-benzoquinol methylase
MNNTQIAIRLAIIRGKIEILERLQKNTKSIKEFIKEEREKLNEENEQLRKDKNVNKGKS